ncbi:MAG: DMT family transporter [Planctomycetota bacterium]|jgi:drug/metabolite transporter (DMT)-like permease
MIESLDNYVGPVAGITTSVLFAGTALLFAGAARRLGTVMVNAVRLALAIVLLAVTHRLATGLWIPPAIAGQVVFLALSGIVGLVIGDQAVFIAFVDIGPRLSMLILASCPLLATLFGWAALGETLEGVAWVGVLLIVVGVGWVALEKPSTTSAYCASRRVRGITLAFIAAAGQAGGLLLSKQGMGHGWLPDDQHLSAQAATLIRMVFGGLGLAPILLMNLYRERRQRARGIWPERVGSRRAGFVLAFLAAFFAGYLAVWLSLVAADRLPLGIAQTLCSLAPVFVLPLAVLIERERVSPRAAIGAFVAVAGTALLFPHAQ